LEASLDLLVLDHDERGDCSDLELRRQVGVLGDVDAVEVERRAVGSR
jgi:hypothetical protein